MMDMMHGQGSMMGSMGFFPLLFWLLILLGIIFIVKSLTANKTTESPLDILKKRYAKGEIDDETFQHMKKELSEEKS